MVVDKSGIFSTNFPNSTWLFKQSTYGGVEHIMADVDHWATYMNRNNLREPYKVETVCGKFLKYNSIFSQVRRKDGRVANICFDCLINYEADEKAEEATTRKDRQNESLRKRYGDLPF